MGRLIAGFPAVPSHIQTVTLGGRQYRIRCTYRERTASWYVDLFDRDGNPIATGRRMSPGWALLSAVGLPGAPEGVLYVRGADGYSRDELGRSLRLVFYPTSELPAPPDLAALEGVTVELET